MSETRRHIAELKLKRNEEIGRVIATALAKGADPKIYQDLAHALEEPLTKENALNPTVQIAKEAYRSWVDRLDSSVTNPSSSSAQIQLVTTSPPDSTSQIGVMGSSSASVSLAPREEQELSRLTRDYEVYSRTYQEMQQRMERANVTQRLGESDEATKFKVLEPARLPLRPVRPNMAKIFFFSLLLGLFIGAGVAFVAEYLDQSFQSAEELQAVMELPILGSVSTIVTEEDLQARRKQRRGWFSFGQNRERFRTYVLGPIWARIDAALVRWGL